MKTETRSEQSVPSEQVADPDGAVVQPTARRLAYKSVLGAVVVGSLTISALWLFVIRPDGGLVLEVPVTESDKQGYEDTAAQVLPAANKEPSVESVDRKLASISSRIDRSFEVQQVHSTVVRHELTAMADGIQTIKAAITDLGESNKQLGRRISEASARLDTLAKEVRALKVVKRTPTAKPKPKSHPVKIPPFQIDAIDVWDDVTYVAVSQSGRVAFLKSGEQQSGWSVTHIDRLKGQVKFQGPAGQAHSISLQR
jgi:hypothetical protein